MPIYALGEFTPNLPSDNEYWIAPDAHVIGQVTLGRNVGIWFGAVIRGDMEPIVVGEDTNVQEGSVLHTDRGYPLKIGNGCTIGHHAIVHGCTIGDNVLVGMGATIMNGAVIGSNSVVGAGSLVTENKVFEGGSLIVGAPGKRIRTLADESIRAIGRSASHYVETWRRFGSTLRRLDHA